MTWSNKHLRDRDCHPRLHLDRYFTEADWKKDVKNSRTYLII